MGKGQAVRLVLWQSNLLKELMGYRMRVGIIDGAVGDDVLVRSGDRVLPVDPEFLEPVSDNLKRHVW